MDLNIDTHKQTDRIVHFIKTTLAKQKIQNVVIGISGGIDSIVSLCLLKKALSPKNIFVAHLYYFGKPFEDLNNVIKSSDIPQENIYYISIKNPVDNLSEILKIKNNEESDRVRFGNIMARIRMITLYDLAKKHNALVCGTENKSEYYLGYFTLFGDQASDFEPIRHLYKTQIYNLARYLKVPDEFIKKAPTAGLWEGQTDENEFGFSYKEADPVLYLYFENNLSIEEIQEKGFKNAEKIINFVKRNAYKHRIPYLLNNN